MSEQSGQELTHPIVLEIMPEDPHDADPAAIGEIGREILNEVKGDGTSVEPIYTGVRGGHELLFELIKHGQVAGEFLWADIQVAWADIYAQRDMIGLISSLITIIAEARPHVKHIFHAREKQEVKQAKLASATSPVQEQHTIKIMLTIDGVATPVEVDNFQDAKAMLELAQEIHAKHPNLKPTAQSEVKIQTVVPKKERRRRR